jgi:hypothetical protein
VCLLEIINLLYISECFPHCKEIGVVKREECVGRKMYISTFFLCVCVFETEFVYLFVVVLPVNVT